MTDPVERFARPPRHAPRPPREAAPGRRRSPWTGPPGRPTAGASATGAAFSTRCAIRTPSRFADLKDIDDQKKRLRENTAQFVAGRPANNVLLTGARGTGKSSLVKAALNEFSKKGLRLIEVDKSDLVDLPDIVDLVADRRERFVVFCDDLSFEASDPGYKSLKVALDGTIAGSADNLLIYATSNRRHLMPEFMDENLEARHVGGEIHPGETTEEKISLSERFGLWLSFYPFDQDQYLDIAAHWVERARRQGRRGHEARGTAVGAGARLPQRPRGLAVRPGLRGPWQPARAGASDEDHRGRRRRHRAARRHLPPRLPSRGKALSRLLGIPRRQDRAGRGCRARRWTRELREELGIEVREATPWITRVYAYTHATVRLHFFRVTAWEGEPQPLEDQAIAWQRVEAPDVAPMLPANAPVLAALALPAVMVVSNAAETGFDAWSLKLSAQVVGEKLLVQIREKGLEPQRVQFLLSRALTRGTPFGARRRGEQRLRRVARRPTACTSRRAR